jgi:hypothetical protein
MEAGAKINNIRWSKGQRNKAGTEVRSCQGGISSHMLR